MPFLLLLFLFSSCAHEDAFHAKDLPEPLRPRRGMPTVTSNPDAPYQALDWRLPQ